MDWSTAIPAIAVIVAIAAAIGFGPLLARKRAAIQQASTTESDTAYTPVSATVNVEVPHEATFLALRKAFDANSFDVCKKLLDLAIEQKGAVNA